MDSQPGGSRGSIYVFDLATRAEVSKFTPSDGSSYQGLGIDLAVSESRTLVGAWGDESNSNTTGSAYLFETITGNQIARLLPTDGAAGRGFGWSVALSEDYALVGAEGDDTNGTDSGSAYLFDASTGVQIAKLLPDDGEANDRFGRSVALAGNLAFVTSYGDDDLENNGGSVYVFDILNGAQVAKIYPTTPMPSLTFGSSIAASGSTIVVGSVGDSINGVGSGSAYVLADLQLVPGDMDNNLVVDMDDIDALLAAPPGAVPAESSILFDLNRDGEVINSVNTSSSDVDYLIHEILLTEFGDTNLDRAVDFADLLTLAQNYQRPGGWALGNFDGLAGVNFADLLMLAQNYGFGTPESLDFNTDLALAFSLVPEPATLGLLMGAGLLALRRRG